MQGNGYYYTSLPKFSLTFSEITEQNLMPVNGNGDNIDGTYQIKGKYDPSLCYLSLK